MLSQKEILEYEVNSSPWACYVYGNFLQSIAGKYFAWKVRRKYPTYCQSMARAKLVDSLRNKLGVDMTKIQSLNEQVDITKVKSGSVVVESVYGGYDIVQPGDPMFSTAVMCAVGYVDSDGSIRPVVYADKPDSEDQTDSGTADLPRVSALSCSRTYLECPVCGEQQLGWIGDPRGQVFECDECKNSYFVPLDVLIKLN